jgi:hypothetical protein
VQAVTCEGCGRAADPTQEAMFQLVTGWRRMYPLTQGLRVRRSEQRYACRSCVEAFERSGMTWQQPSLFESP